MKTKVLVCSAWPPTVGGASTFARRLANDSRLQEQFTIVPHEIVKRPTIYIAADLPATKSATAPVRKLVSGLGNFWKFLKKLVKDRPEIVQIHYNGPSRGPLLLEVTLYLLAGRASGARTIVRHGSGLHLHLLPRKSFWSWFARKVYMGMMNALIVQDQKLVPEHVRWLADTGSSVKIIAVPNTVDTGKYQAAPARMSDASTERPFRIGCIAGPETERKGGFVLVDAVRQITTDRLIDGFVIDAIATTPEFVDATKRHGLADLFENRGVLDEPRKLEWFHTLDVFILPSFREGFPNVLIEAMACGLPVVASTVGAVPEVITDGADGIMIEPGDQQALIAALVRLWEKPQERRQMGAKARETTVGRYAVDGPWIESIIALYRELAPAEKM